MKRFAGFPAGRPLSQRFVAATAAAVALGALLAVIVSAPAAWLSRALADATGQRLLLAEARGSVWSGSAVAVLTGGDGSRDASALPGRLHWRLVPDGLGIAVLARHACCINGELRLRIEPGLGRVTVSLPPTTGAVGQWPAAWLAGLGTPFNTLQLGGSVGLSTTSGLRWASAQGRWQLSGDAALSLSDISSRVSTLPTLGSYRVDLAGGSIAQITLSTLQGPLRLAGSGQWAAAGMRFRGDARADPGAESALNNLLNIIGRRQGTLAVISIG